MRHISTNFITIDAARCQACWRCVNACPQDVLGKTRVPFHQHVHVDHAESCIGCRACMKICPAQAISATREGKQ